MKDFCSVSDDVVGCDIESGINFTQNFFSHLNIIHGARLPDSMRFNLQPESFSVHLDKELPLEHMSWSGISNAHSLTKLFDYILFQSNLLSYETIVDKMLGNIESKYDVALGVITNFSQGGMNAERGGFNTNGLEWYGWSGWGGSRVMFSPKHKAIIAYTVTSFEHPLFTHHMARTVFRLVNPVIIDHLKD